MRKMFGTIIEFFHSIYCAVKANGKDKLSFVIVLIACVATVIYMQNDFENTIYEELKSTMIEIDDTKKREHRDGFSNSMATYYNIKAAMKEHREIIGCEYILLLEYHNGAENIATGYQFCKFDITIQVCGDNVQYIHIDDYRDESIFKYDIFIHERILKNRLSLFTVDEIEKIDPNFHYQLLKSTNDINTIVTSHIYFEGHKAGALIYLFKESDTSKIKKLDVANCASKVEEILINEKN